ncbi:hypothetical protein JTB14_017553 [Gonioctena quinquepunctata]|nr:hypothetical protein JTB14_017553 [Gonioctena quinquepunctata]
MDWEDFKRIIDKLEDISKQDVLETSLNNMTISAEKQQTCNCSCKNNIGLQNPPRSNFNPNFRQTGTRSFQQPPRFSHPQNYSYTRPNYFTTPQTRIPFAPRQPFNKFHQNHNTNYSPKGKTPTTLILHQDIKIFTSPTLPKEHPHNHTLPETKILFLILELMREDQNVKSVTE